MKESDNYTMQKVEQLVCDVVTWLTSRDKPPLKTEDIYIGHGNIFSHIAMARNFIFTILHNNYGFTYTEIAQRADMKTTSIMRCVRKCTQLCEYDTLYKQVQSMITNKLEEMYEKQK